MTSIRVSAAPKWGVAAGGIGPPKGGQNLRTDSRPKPSSRKLKFLPVERHDLRGRGRVLGGISP